MDATPDSATAVIELLIAKDLLGSVGLSASHARTMKTRNSIPGEWDTRIVEAATKAGLPISFELLARLRAPQIQEAQA
jgi:hypothetical protein